MKINLKIDRLILDGVNIPHQQINELKASVEKELHELLLNDGLATATQSTFNKQVTSNRPISIKTDHQPKDVGKQIGNAIFRSIRK